MSGGMTLPALALVWLSLWPQDPVHPDLAELGPRWEQAMVACGVPALAMVLVEGDEVVHRATLGRRDPAREAPVTKDTIFYIASATKPYVAFALAQLAEQGKVELDAPVARYLPRFRLADAELTKTITVRDLLCHRHGLNSREIVLLDAYTGEITEDRYYHFLERVEPAGHVEYTNVHFTLAGRVIEAVSGLSWRDRLAKHVFEPAGMTRTSGYADWMYAQDDVAIPATVVDGRARPTSVRKNDRTMHAAGGLGTSIDDLARWLRLQLGRGAIDGRRLLSERGTEASWELLTEEHEEEPLGTSEGYALGWKRSRYRGHLMLSHGGGYAGSSSWVTFLPELGLGLAVVATGGDGALGACAVVACDTYERLVADDEIRDLLPRALERARGRGAESAPEPVAASAVRLARPLADYAGVYTNEWFGTLTLRAGADGLAASLGALALGLEVLAPDRLRLDAGLFESEVTLELAGGKVAALVLDIDGPVRFAR